MVRKTGKTLDQIIRFLLNRTAVGTLVTFLLTYPLIHLGLQVEKLRDKEVSQIEILEDGSVHFIEKDGEKT